MTSRDDWGPLRRSVWHIWVGLLGTTGFIFAPFVVGGLVETAGLSAAQAGLVVGVEVLGSAASAVLIAFDVWRPRESRLALCALALLAVGNLASVVSRGVLALLCVRFIAGAAAGLAQSNCLIQLARLPNPERVFAAFLATTLLFAALTSSMLPLVIAQWGIAGLFAILAAAAGLSALAAASMSRPTPISAQSAGTDSLDSPAGERTIALVAVCMFFAVQGAVWAFIERIGHSRGIAPNALGTALALASLGGLAGAGAAGAVGVRLGRRSPLLLAGSAAALLIAMLTLTNTNKQFAIAASALQFCWCFSYPYYMGVLTSSLRGSQAMAAPVVMQSAGLGCGPLLAAVAVAGGGYSALSLAAVVTTLISTSLGWVAAGSRLPSCKTN